MAFGLSNFILNLTQWSVDKFYLFSYLFASILQLLESLNQKLHVCEHLFLVLPIDSDLLPCCQVHLFHCLEFSGIYSQVCWNWKGSVFTVSHWQLPRTAGKLEFSALWHEQSQISWSFIYYSEEKCFLFISSDNLDSTLEVKILNSIWMFQLNVRKICKEKLLLDYFLKVDALKFVGIVFC